MHAEIDRPFHLLWLWRKRGEEGKERIWIRDLWKTQFYFLAFCFLKLASFEKGFPVSSVGKESICNSGDPGWFLGWEIHWRRDRLPTPVLLGFPCGAAGKESTCNVGNLGSIPGLGRSPGEGKGYPLQYSGLENSMDCIVHGVTKSQTWMSNFHFYTFFLLECFQHILAAFL